LRLFILFFFLLLGFLKLHLCDRGLLCLSFSGLALIGMAFHVLFPLLIVACALAGGTGNVRFFVFLGELGPGLSDDFGDVCDGVS
jgi:hypothetical protein